MINLLLVVVTMAGITAADVSLEPIADVDNKLSADTHVDTPVVTEVIVTNAKGIIVAAVVPVDPTYAPIKAEDKPVIQVDVVRMGEQKAKRLEREKVERERIEKETAERIEKEKVELERIERERIAIEKLEQEKQQQEQLLAATKVTEPSATTAPTLTNNVDATLIAQLVHAEANGETYTGKVAVAEVVLNRVKSGEFPNNVSDVVYQSGQFSPVGDGSINNSPTSEDVQAVNEALNGSTYAQGALYFYNPQVATSRWLDTLPTKTVIGRHYFK